MFLVMGITGKVGGATATHLLAQGKKVRALVRDRAKAASWTDQGVELVDGDWNNAAAIERALKGVDGAFVMLPAVFSTFAGFQGSQGRHRELCRGADQGRAAACGRALVDGGEPHQRAGMITALSLLEQGFRKLTSPTAFVRAGGFFENYLSACASPQVARFPFTTIRPAGNRRWSRRTISVPR